MEKRFQLGDRVRDEEGMEGTVTEVWANGMVDVVDDEGTEYPFFHPNELDLIAPGHGIPLNPTIVCLCGSTRFHREFQEVNYWETMAGRIVLSVGFYPHAAGQMHGESVGATQDQKAALDVLHLRKIDLADQVLILDVDGYVGDSTRRELEYARQNGKTVRWLEPPADPALVQPGDAINDPLPASPALPDGWRDNPFASRYDYYD